MDSCSPPLISSFFCVDYNNVNLFQREDVCTNMFCSFFAQIKFDVSDRELVYLETNSKSEKNLLTSDCEICMACLLVAVYWHELLQFVKKKFNITLLACSFMISLAVSMITLCFTIFRPPARFEFQFIYLLHLIISVA